jgi:hypothetical protein
LSRCRTLTLSWMRREALSGSPNSTSPRATIRCGSGRRIGGRRAFVLNSGNSNGRSCRLDFRDHRRCLCES